MIIIALPSDEFVYRLGSNEETDQCIEAPRIEPTKIAEIEIYLKILSLKVNTSSDHVYFVLHHLHNNHLRKMLKNCVIHEKFLNFEIISFAKAMLINALKEFQNSPSKDDIIWIFFETKKDIICYWWKNQKGYGWKNEGLHCCGPEIKDLKNLGLEKKTSKVPFIFVYDCDGQINENTFRELFPNNKGLTFKLFENFKYWRNCTTENYKIEPFLDRKIDVILYDTPIFSHEKYWSLPVNETTLVNVNESGSLIKVYDHGECIKTLPFKTLGQYRINVRIDTNGIFKIDVVKEPSLELNEDGEQPY